MVFIATRVAVVCGLQPFKPRAIKFARRRFHRAQSSHYFSVTPKKQIYARFENVGLCCNCTAYAWQVWQFTVRCWEVEVQGYKGGVKARLTYPNLIRDENASRHHSKASISFLVSRSITLERLAS